MTPKRSTGGATHWYRKAAEQGVARAHSDLGVIYAEGEGVPVDDVQAYAWYSIVATQGHEDSKEYKGNIKKEMTCEQIAEAQKLSSEYWEKYVMPFKKN